MIWIIDLTFHIVCVLEGSVGKLHVPFPHLGRAVGHIEGLDQQLVKVVTSLSEMALSPF